MNKVLSEYTAAAENGSPLYINTVRDHFEALPERTRLDLWLLLIDGQAYRRFELSLPVKIDDPAVRNLASDYLKAEIYNIISSLGGRELSIYFDSGVEGLESLLEQIPADFGIGQKRRDRRGFGRCVNVADRMLDTLLPENGIQFSINLADIRSMPEHPEQVENLTEKPEVFRLPVQLLKNRRILGVDIGGTDIKLALVANGSIIALKEYDWFPALFTQSEELVRPIELLCRLMSVKQACELGKTKIPSEIISLVEEAMKPDAGHDLMEKACREASHHISAEDGLFDGIGLCFPDVVVNDKVVGGEVYKTRGIRNNPDLDYEADFRQLTHLNEILGAFCHSPGAVSFTNDGPMAAFTAAVELAASGREDELSEGFFAHTLGTELGTGWVREDGSIPDIPLEVYNYIIDLGSIPERNYDPDDLRSVLNFNTNLPGTLQKYASQSGVFRLALKYFPQRRPELMLDLIMKGLVQNEPGTGEVRLLVPSQEPDMRKPFLEHMMALFEHEDDEVNRKIWFEIGESLGVTMIETERILRPKSKKRILFGRLVKRRKCFEAMVEGARSLAPEISMEVADSGLAYTPLMIQLKDDEHFTVAQFAQAVGAVYFAIHGMIGKQLILPD